jgi:hypothetical protein
MANRELQFTLEGAVAEVLATLTGLDLEYDPSLDRFQSITRALNRALRAVALEHDWAYFSSTENAGVTSEGMQDLELNSTLRPRIINDDAVRLVNSLGRTVRWCYFIPRDALHKYINRAGLWVSITRTTLSFSRPFLIGEAGLQIMVPVMREPRMFNLPKGTTISKSVLNQLIDFDYPDLVIARAALYMADSDPVMQPRVQTLEARYKDIMYQLVDRDTKMTDSPYENDFVVPMDGALEGRTNPLSHGHPHADERYR